MSAYDKTVDDIRGIFDDYEGWETSNTPPPKKNNIYELGAIDERTNFRTMAQLRRAPEYESTIAKIMSATGATPEVIESEMRSMYGNRVGDYYSGNASIFGWGKAPENKLHIPWQQDYTVYKVTERINKRFGQPFLTHDSFTGRESAAYSRVAHHENIGPMAHFKSMGVEVRQGEKPPEGWILRGTTAYPPEALAMGTGRVLKGGSVFTGVEGGKFLKRTWTDVHGEAVTMTGLKEIMSRGTAGGSRYRANLGTTVDLLVKGLLPSGQGEYDPLVVGQGKWRFNATITLPREMPEGWKPEDIYGKPLFQNERGKFQVAQGMGFHVSGAEQIVPEASRIRVNRRVSKAGEVTETRTLMISGTAYGEQGSGAYVIKGGESKSGGSAIASMGDVFNVTAGGKRVQNLAVMDEALDLHSLAYKAAQAFSPEEYRRVVGTRWGKDSAQKVWEHLHATGKIQDVTFTQRMFLGIGEMQNPQAQGILSSGYGRIVGDVEETEEGRFANVEITAPAFVGEREVIFQKNLEHRKQRVGFSDAWLLTNLENPELASEMSRYSSHEMYRQGSFYGAVLANQGEAPYYQAVEGKEIVERWGPLRATALERARAEDVLGLGEKEGEFGVEAYILRQMHELTGEAGMVFRPSEFGLEGKDLYLPNPETLLRKFSSGDVDEQLFGLPKGVAQIFEGAYQLMSGEGDVERIMADTQMRLDRVREELASASSSASARRGWLDLAWPKIGGRIQALHGLAPSEAWIPQKQLTKLLSGIWGNEAMGGLEIAKRYEGPEQAAEAILRGDEKSPEFIINRQPLMKPSDADVRIRAISLDTLSKRVGYDVYPTEANMMGTRISSVVAAAVGGDYDADPFQILAGLKQGKFDWNSEILRRGIAHSAGELTGLVKKIEGSRRDIAEAGGTQGLLQFRSYELALADIVEESRSPEKSGVAIGRTYNAFQRAFASMQMDPMVAARMLGEIGEPMYQVGIDFSAMGPNSKEFLDVLGANWATGGFRSSTLQKGVGSYRSFINKQIDLALGLGEEYNASPEAIAGLLMQGDDARFDLLTEQIARKDKPGVIGTLLDNGGDTAGKRNVNAIMASPQMRLFASAALEKATSDRVETGKGLDYNALPEWQQKLVREGRARRDMQSLLSRGAGARIADIGEFKRVMGAMVNEGLMHPALSKQLERVFRASGVIESKPRKQKPIPQIPRTQAEAASWLTSVSGIGKKVAGAVSERFGAHLPNVLANWPEMLAEVKGVGSGRLEAIREKYSSDFKGGFATRVVFNPKTGQMEIGRGQREAPLEAKQVGQPIVTPSPAPPAPPEPPASPVPPEPPAPPEPPSNPLVSNKLLDKIRQSPEHYGYSLERALNAVLSGDEGDYNELVQNDRVAYAGSQRSFSRELVETLQAEQTPESREILGKLYQAAENAGIPLVGQVSKQQYAATTAMDAQEPVLFHRSRQAASGPLRDYLKSQPAGMIDQMRQVVAKAAKSGTFTIFGSDDSAMHWGAYTQLAKQMGYDIGKPVSTPSGTITSSISPIQQQSTTQATPALAPSVTQAAAVAGMKQRSLVFGGRVYQAGGGIPPSSNIPPGGGAPPTGGTPPSSKPSNNQDTEARYKDLMSRVKGFTAGNIIPAVSNTVMATGESTSRQIGIRAMPTPEEMGLLRVTAMEYDPEGQMEMLAATRNAVLSTYSRPPKDKHELDLLRRGKKFLTVLSGISRTLYQGHRYSKQLLEEAREIDVERGTAGTPTSIEAEVGQYLGGFVKGHEAFAGEARTQAEAITEGYMNLTGVASRIDPETGEDIPVGEKSARAIKWLENFISYKGMSAEEARAARKQKQNTTFVDAIRGIRSGALAGMSDDEQLQSISGLDVSASQRTILGKIASGETLSRAERGRAFASGATPADLTTQQADLEQQLNDATTKLIEARKVATDKTKSASSREAAWGEAVKDYQLQMGRIFKQAYGEGGADRVQQIAEQAEGMLGGGGREPVISDKFSAGKFAFGLRSLFTPFSPESAMIRFVWNRATGGAGKEGVQAYLNDYMVSRGDMALATGDASGIGGVGEEMLRYQQARKQNQIAGARALYQAWGWTQKPASAGVIQGVYGPALGIGVAAGLGAFKLNIASSLATTLGTTAAGAAGVIGGVVGLSAAALGTGVYAYNASSPTMENYVAAQRELANYGKRNVIDSAVGGFGLALRGVGQIVRNPQSVIDYRTEQLRNFDPKNLLFQSVGTGVGIQFAQRGQEEIARLSNLPVTSLTAEQASGAYDSLAAKITSIDSYSGMDPAEVKSILAKIQMSTGLSNIGSLEAGGIENLAETVAMFSATGIDPMQLRMVDNLGLTLGTSSGIGELFSRQKQSFWDAQGWGRQGMRRSGSTALGRSHPQSMFATAEFDSMWAFEDKTNEINSQVRQFGENMSWEQIQYQYGDVAASFRGFGGAIGASGTMAAIQSVNIGAGQIGGLLRKQWNLQDHSRQLQYATTFGGNFGGVGFTGDLNFQQMEMDMSYRQSMASAGISAAQVAEGRRFQLVTRGWEHEDIATNRERSLTQRGWEMEDIGTQYNRGVRRLDWQAEDIGIGIERFERGKEYQWWQVGWQERMTAMQRGWQKEDFAFERSNSQLQFGWQMQDLDESLRYATGSDRRQILKQRNRAVIQQGIQEGRLTTQESRTEETWKMEDEAFEKKKERLAEEDKYQEENFTRQLARLAEQRAWLDEDYNRNMTRLNAKASWEDEDYEKTLKRLSEREVHEDRVAALQAAAAGQAIANIEERYALEKKKFDEKKEELRIQWDLEDDRIAIQRDSEAKSLTWALQQQLLSDKMAENQEAANLFTTMVQRMIDAEKEQVFTRMIDMMDKIIEASSKRLPISGWSDVGAGGP